MEKIDLTQAHLVFQMNPNVTTISGLAVWYCMLVILIVLAPPFS